MRLILERRSNEIEGRAIVVVPPKNKREVLLDIRDLSVSFFQSGEEITAVDKISFSIFKGESVGLVGESGSGKSVTALSVMQLLDYPAARHPSGEILFEGKNLMGMPHSQLRHVRGNKISMIFQEPMTSLNPLHTVGKQIGEILDIHKGMGEAASRVRTLELLHQVGIHNPETRLQSFPHQLSGGQRQRVMIAMALANEPDLLIADEPTTALDVTVQAQILKLLKDLQREIGMAMLLITHDLSVVRKVTDRVCIMTKGKIVEEGETACVFARPKHDYTKRLLSAEPTGNPPISDHRAPVVLQANNIKVWFPIKRGLLRRTVDHIKAVDDVSLELRAGQTLGIVGESGSGKTTLGLALVRLISSSGSITYQGERLDGKTFRAMRSLRRDIQVVFQDPYGSLSPRLSVGQIVEEGLRVQDYSMSFENRRSRVSSVLDEVGIAPDSQERYPHEFSGGQRQRIAIARALVLEPKFVVLDEPTSALDMSVQAQIVDLLRDIQRRRNLAFLFISHDLKVVRALANDVIVMRNGRVVEQGAAVDVFEQPRSDYTKALMAAAFELEVVSGDVVAQ